MNINIHSSIINLSFALNPLKLNVQINEQINDRLMEINVQKPREARKTSLKLTIY